MDGEKEIYIPKARVLMRLQYLLLLVLLTPALGLFIPDITMRVDISSTVVNVGQPILINLTLVNQNNYENVYSLDVIGPYPQWLSMYEYYGTVPANGVKVIPLSITPQNGGSYTYNAILSQGQIQYVKENIVFDVITSGNWDEVVPKTLEITVPDSVVPGVNLEIFMTAGGFEPAEGEIVLSKGDNEISRWLVPIHKREGMLTVQVPDGILAGTYIVTLFAGPAKASAEFNVPQMKRVEESKSIDNVLFGRSVTLSVKNKGNIVSEGEISDQLMWYERWFSRFSEKPTITGSKITWLYHLTPGQEKKITYSVSFVPLVLGVFVLIILFAYFASESSEVSVQKNVTAKDGEVKVQVLIENVSKEPVKSVKIIDGIPPLSRTNFDQKPERKLRTTDGIIISWSGGELKPSGRLMFSYSMQLVETIGRVHLPRVSVEYKDKNGKVKTATSTSPYV